VALCDHECQQSREVACRKPACQRTRAHTTTDAPTHVMTIES
jgi:hypothetical protein